MPPRCSHLQATESVTVGSASATPVTSGTTATAPPRRTAVFPATGRCAAAGAPASVGSVSAPSRGLLERRVRSVPPAQASVALKGTHGRVREGILTGGKGSFLVPGRLISQRFTPASLNRGDKPQASLPMLGAHAKQPKSSPGRQAASIAAQVLVEVTSPFISSAVLLCRKGWQHQFCCALSCKHLGAESCRGGDGCLPCSDGGALGISLRQAQRSNAACLDLRQDGFCSS